MSFPTRAEVSVNWVPASCMPSPLSPQKRMVTAGRVVLRLPLAWAGGNSVDSVEVIIKVRLPVHFGRAVRPLSLPGRNPYIAPVGAGLRAHPRLMREQRRADAEVRPHLLAC